MIYTAYSHEYFTASQMPEMAEKIRKGLINLAEETTLVSWALQDNPSLNPNNLKTKIFNGCFFVYN